MSRAIPRRLLPHVDAITVEALKGVSGAGRSFHPPVTVKCSLIVDGISLAGTQYEREPEVSGVFYCDRSAFEKLPVPDSRVRLWHGSEDEHEAFVKRVERYMDPRLGDVLVVVLR